jgi:hypothetical protein
MSFDSSTPARLVRTYRLSPAGELDVTADDHAVEGGAAPNLAFAYEEAARAPSGTAGTLEIRRSTSRRLDVTFQLTLREGSDEASTAASFERAARFLLNLAAYDLALRPSTGLPTDADALRYVRRDSNE